MLDGVHLVPELCPGGVHVGDHGPDISHDSGEYEDTEEEVNCDEEILRVLLRLRGLPDGGEGQGGPVEAVDVLCGEGVIALTVNLILFSVDYINV